MDRPHKTYIHLAVDNLEQNIGFYSALFQSEPSVVEADYAKWMLDDPRVNFAISSRGRPPGLDHLSIQVETREELEAVQQGLADAALPVAHKNRQPAAMPSLINTGASIHKVLPGRHSIPLFGDDQVIQLESAASCCKPKA